MDVDAHMDADDDRACHIVSPLIGDIIKQISFPLGKKVKEEDNKSF